MTFFDHLIDSGLNQLYILNIEVGQERSIIQAILDVQQNDPYSTTGYLLRKFQ